jgi:hypothetical protein
MPMTANRDPWLTILEEGAQLLQAGKAEEAAQTLAGLQALFDPTASRPSPALAAQARDLLQRCSAAAADLRQHSVQDLSRLASGQRARVYRRSGQGPR